MWPFKSLKTGASSGTLSCDGKHHEWSGWTLYGVDGTAYSFIFRQGVPYSELRQRRHCIFCNFTEDKQVNE